MNLRSGLSSLGMALCLTSLAGCHSAPSQRPMKAGPVDTGAGTLTQARKYLEGRWTLESFEVYPPGGPAITLKGSGTLSYDEFSNLRIEIRADQASADLLRAAGIDIRDGVISSDGLTAVEIQNHTLQYVVPGQTNTTEPTEELLGTVANEQRSNDHAQDQQAHINRHFPFLSRLFIACWIIDSCRLEY